MQWMQCDNCKAMTAMQGINVIQSLQCNEYNALHNNPGVKFH